MSVDDKGYDIKEEGWFQGLSGALGDSINDKRVVPVPAKGNQLIDDHFFIPSHIKHIPYKFLCGMDIVYFAALFCAGRIC